MDPASWDVCFGTIKHHFVDNNWYVIATDLVSDKEVRSRRHWHRPPH